MEYIVYIYNILACNYNKYENALIPFKKAPLGYFLFFMIYVLIFFTPIYHTLKESKIFIWLKKKPNIIPPGGHLKTEDTCDIALWEIVTSRR